MSEAHQNSKWFKEKSSSSPEPSEESVHQSNVAQVEYRFGCSEISDTMLGYFAAVVVQSRGHTGGWTTGSPAGLLRLLADTCVLFSNPPNDRTCLLTLDSFTMLTHPIFIPFLFFIFYMESKSVGNHSREVWPVRMSAGWTFGKLHIDFTTMPRPPPPSHRTFWFISELKAEVCKESVLQSRLSILRCQRPAS